MSSVCKTMPTVYIQMDGWMDRQNDKQIFTADVEKKGQFLCAITDVEHTVETQVCVLGSCKKQNNRCISPTETSAGVVCWSPTMVGAGAGQ